MRELITSIRRTPYQSLGSFLILFLTLFLALFFFTLTAFLYGILPHVEAQLQVVVFFNTEVEEKSILKIKDQLEKTGKTSSVTYISQQEALKIYKDLANESDDPLVLEMVSENILPASLEVYASRPIYLSELADFLEQQPGVNEVVFKGNLADQLITVTNMLRRISLALLVMLVTITISVLMTMTAFKISLKKEEIEVLQLIGASKGYIRRPFLIEGMLFGIISGTIAFAAFYSVIIYYYYYQSFLRSFLSGLPKLTFANLDAFNVYVLPPSIEFVVLSYALIALFGAMIGLIGNYTAASKYIK